MSQLSLNSDYNEDTEERSTFFANVILPINLPGTYTYRIPQILVDKVLIGGRVIVQFGRTRILTGVVDAIHQNVPKKYEAKYILENLDDNPSFNDEQLAFFRWAADYYMCTLGEVVNAALPSGLKLTSESFIQLNPEFTGKFDSTHFTENEGKLLNHLTEVARMTYQDVSDLLGIKLVHPIVKSLIQKNCVLIFDKIKDKFAPQKKKYISLNQDNLRGTEPLKALFEILEKKPKQLDVLLKFLNLIDFELDETSWTQEVKKDDLLGPQISSSSLRTLIKNGYLIETEKIVPRFSRSKVSSFAARALSDDQQLALEEVIKSFEKNKPVLLHGITGSGKTEIYVEVIRQVLEEGGQVLYLLPEIALTTQIVNRLIRMFGDTVGVYHSRFSDNERVEIWNDIKEGKLNFVVGVRSSIFLPFEDLSLVVVDEEHDPSFKQYEPAPRFHARDCALWLAHRHGARILLGSATPSVESYQNAIDGKYTLVTLDKRFGGVSLPSIDVGNTLTARKSKRMKGEFTPELLTALTHTLKQDKQAIIFQNRRGYSPYLICDNCNHVPRCQNCDVSLTYHMYLQELICHYCGHKEPLPMVCEACGSTELRTVGFGTEKIEDDLKLLFPEAVVQRMDQDTTRSKTAYQTIIERFENGETDILVGTQMISKGLDFDNVSLVGVLGFDHLLHFPDFRSHERTYQMTAQVSGRSGRKEKGMVIIQTSDPENELLEMVKRDDYKRFFTREVLERAKYGYPPFYRLIKVILKHPDQSELHIVGANFFETLSAELGSHRVLGPQQPLVSRIKNLFLLEVLVKVEKKGINIRKVKTLIFEKTRQLRRDKRSQKLRIVFDVDPV